MNFLSTAKNTTSGMRFYQNLILLLLLALALPVGAQIGLPNATPVTQNFNGMGNAATAALPANWKMSPAGDAAPTWANAGNFTTTTQQASSGTPATGARYNWATSAGTDRALGVMTSGSFAAPNSIMAHYQNTNGSFITDLAISYNGERYRTNTAAANIDFYYSLDGLNWTAVAAGNVPAASLPIGTSSYAFGTPLTVPVSFSITGLGVANGGNIYLRWNINTTGSNSQGIAIDDVSVTASFGTTCSTPTTQASSLAVTATTNGGASFSWTNGGATSGSMMVINPAAQASVAPTSGTAYTANANYTSAGQINTNNRVVYRGNATAASVTGLNPGTQYTATIYAYNDPGACYNTAAPETVSFYTLANEPTAHPGAGTFTCTTASVSQINLSFPAANTLTNATGYVILYRVGAAPTGLPADATLYTVGDAIGDATVAAYVTSAATSASITGLNAGTTYWFSIIPYGSNLSIAQTLNYRTAATIRTTNCTTVTSPEINIRGAGQTINPGNTPIGVDNTLFAAQAVGTPSAPKAYEIQNLGNANLVLTGSSPYVTIGGTNASDFAVTTAATSPIAPSGNSTFQITFTPSAPGVRTATVTVGSNDTTEPTYTFNIQGSGDDREIEVYGKGISIPSGNAAISVADNTQYGNVNVTAGTSVRSYSVFNPGTIALTVSGVTISGADAADFSVTTSPAATVNPGASTVLTVTFNPTTLGVKNALVTINNNDGNESVYTFAIQGTGIDYIDCGLGTVEVIAQQDFEVAPAAPVMAYAYTQDTAPVGTVTIGGGTGRGSSRTVSSNMYIGARSFQIPGHLVNSGVEKTTTVTFATVNTSTFQNVSLSFALGGYSTNNSQGMDTSPEKVSVYVSTDGGATWSQEVDIYGASNSIWDINTSTGAASTDFDGNNITTVFNTPVISPGVGSVNQGFRSVTLNNLPSVSQLRVRISLSVDRQDEIWVIDNVVIQGRKEATTTWNGTAWSNGAPTPTVRAIIAGPYNTGTNGNIQTCQCQVNPGVTLTVAGNTSLEIQNNLLSSGTVNVASSGSLVQVNNYAANTGSISVVRDVNLKKYDYVYWSAPVANFAVTGVSPGTASNFIFKWLPTQAGSFGVWTGTSEVMVPGRGYIVRSPSVWPTTLTNFTATFSGAPNNGIITPTIERGNYTGAPYPSPTNPAVLVTNKDDNWNLVGNPYPSSIRALDFLTTNTNIEGAVRLWTHGALPNSGVTDPFYGNFMYNYNSNDYIVYNGTATTSGPAGFNGYIASGQAFFIQMNDGPAATQTVTFNNAMRNRTYGNSQFYRQDVNPTDAGRALNGELDPSRIWLDLVGPGQIVSRAVVGYVEGATYEKDRLYDAYGRIENSQSLYTLINAEPMAIQGRPLPVNQHDKVPVGVSITQPGTYKLAIAAVDGMFANTDVFLEDKLLGLVHNLKQTPYEFLAAPGSMDARFELRYTDMALSNSGFTATNGIAVISDKQTISVRSQSDPISEVILYDIAGREIARRSGINATQIQINDLKAQHQAIVVKIVLQDGQITSRKIIL